MSARSPGARDAFVRGLVIGARITSGHVVTTRWVRDNLGVSRATAKRDMLAAELELSAERSGNELKGARP